MLGPKTENSIEGGDSNTQIGHNSGTIIFGLNNEQIHAAYLAALEALERKADREKEEIRQSYERLIESERRSHQYKIKRMALSMQVLISGYTEWPEANDEDE